VASAAVARQNSGQAWPRVCVNVLGGHLHVGFDDDADMTYLTGPAVIVARGELTLPKPANE